MSSSEVVPPGRLLYVMGASGAGKDRLLRGVGQRLRHDHSVRVARRTITRPPARESEDHGYLTVEAFRAREQAGAFALAWEAHGHRYGVGREIDQWLGAGLTVLVNGSRAFLHQALFRYPRSLVPILIDVPDELLEQRLARRGREAAEEIRQRLDRHRRLHPELTSEVIRIDNSGSPEAAIERLVELVRNREQASCG